MAEREPDLWEGPASPSWWGFGVAESPVGIPSRAVLGGIMPISTTDAETKGAHPPGELQYITVIMRTRPDGLSRHLPSVAVRRPSRCLLSQRSVDDALHQRLKIFDSHHLRWMVSVLPPGRRCRALSRFLRGAARGTLLIHRFKGCPAE